MAITGAFAQKARENMPVTWAALEKSRDYGEQLIQGKIDLVKLRLFGSVVSTASESTYDLRVQDFVGRLIAIELVPAGADFWSSQAVSVSAEGKRENKQYLDRVRNLWQLHERLLESTRNDLEEVELILDVQPASRKRKQRGIAVGIPTSVHVTPDPFGFPTPFGLPEETEEEATG